MKWNLIFFFFRLCHYLIYLYIRKHWNLIFFLFCLAVFLGTWAVGYIHNDFNVELATTREGGWAGTNAPLFYLIESYWDWGGLAGVFILSALLFSLSAVSLWGIFRAFNLPLWILIVFCIGNYKIFQYITSASRDAMLFSFSAAFTFYLLLAVYKKEYFWFMLLALLACMLLVKSFALFFVILLVFALLWNAALGRIVSLMKAHLAVLVMQPLIENRIGNWGGAVKEFFSNRLLLFLLFFPAFFISAIALLKKSDWFHIAVLTLLGVSIACMLPFHTPGLIVRYVAPTFPLLAFFIAMAINETGSRRLKVLIFLPWLFLVFQAALFIL